MKYLFSIIRFVPDSARGEQINLGLLVGSGDEWVIRIVEDASRASALECKYPGTPVLPGVLTRLAHISDVLDAFTSGLKMGFVPSEEWMRELSRDNQNGLQFEGPLPILAETAVEAFDTLWDELIAS